MKHIINSAANPNRETAQKVSNGDFQLDFRALETNEIQDSAMSKIINTAKQNITCAATNDNNQNGDDDGGNFPSAFPANIKDTENEPEQASNSCIDIDKVSSKTGIDKKELQELCVVSTSRHIETPTNLTDLRKFITINYGFANTAIALVKKSILSQEERKFFLKMAQNYGYAWLKGEVQLGNEIRKIVSCKGKRTDLAANDNQRKNR